MIQLTYPSSEFFSLCEASARGRKKLNCDSKNVIASEARQLTRKELLPPRGGASEPKASGGGAADGNNVSVPPTVRLRASPLALWLPLEGGAVLFEDIFS